MLNLDLSLKWHDARLLSHFLMYERQEKKGGINLTLFLLPTLKNLIL